MLDIVKETILGLFSYFVNDNIHGAVTLLISASSLSVEVLDLPIVSSATTMFQELAFVILGIKVLFDIFTTYILYKTGDPEANPSQLVFSTILSVIAITSIPIITRQLFELGINLSLDVNNISTTDNTTIEDYLAALPTMAFGMVIVDILAIICTIAIAIQAYIRGAELAMLSVIGPLMAINVSSTNMNLWSQWIKQVILVCITQAIQLVMIEALFYTIIMKVTLVSLQDIIMVLAWLIFIIKTPKFLQQFMYSTGVGGAGAALAKQGGSMYIMRKMMTKG